MIIEKEYTLTSSAVKKLLTVLEQVNKNDLASDLIASIKEKIVNNRLSVDDEMGRNIYDTLYALFDEAYDEVAFHTETIDTLRKKLKKDLSPIAQHAQSLKATFLETMKLPRGERHAAQDVMNERMSREIEAVVNRIFEEWGIEPVSFELDYLGISLLSGDRVFDMINWGCQHNSNTQNMPMPPEEIQDLVIRTKTLLENLQAITKQIASLSLHLDFEDEAAISLRETKVTIKEAQFLLASGYCEE
jgi:hypothetical protein